MPRLWQGGDRGASVSTGFERTSGLDLAIDMDQMDPPLVALTLCWALSPGWSGRVGSLALQNRPLGRRLVDVGQPDGHEDAGHTRS
jgi:hypothetical protein